MATLQCRVVSAREELYSGEISMLIASGTEGEIGILPGHTPLITLLKPGPMRVQTPNGEEEVIYVSGGVLEVQPKMVTVLADTAMRAHNLDESKIVEARKKAEASAGEVKKKIKISKSLLKNALKGIGKK